jgi:hypothetical protein
MTSFIHSKHLPLSIKFLPLYFLILDRFFSCQLHFYLNINHRSPMFGNLQTLLPFLDSFCPSPPSCCLLRNDVVLGESPTCNFLELNSVVLFVVSFTITRCLVHCCYQHLHSVLFLLLNLGYNCALFI